MENKRFREDLYHRLSVIVIEVPPLRERKDDINLLVKRFLSDISTMQGRAAIEITGDALEELKSYYWSGNVRELHNVVERLVILSDKEISKEDVEKYVKPLML